MTSNNTTTYVMTQHISDAQLTVIKFSSIAIAIIGTLSNTTMIVAIIYGKLYKNDIFLKILNLLLCNLIHCVLFLPLIAVQAFTGFWTNNELVCNAISFGLFSNLGTELFGYVCISLNRCLCIVNKSLHKKLYGNFRILAMEWILSWLIYPTILAFPLFGIFSHYQYAPKKLVCHPFIGPDCRGYCLFVFIFAFLSTVPIIGYSYFRIIVVYVGVQRKAAKYREHSKTNTVIHMDDNNSHGATVGNISEHSNDGTHHRRVLSVRRKAEIKMAFSIMAIIVLFMTCRLPFISLYIYDPSMTKVDPFVHTVSIYIGSNLSWINPYIYALTNSQIRHSLVKMYKTFRSKA